MNNCVHAMKQVFVQKRHNFAPGFRKTETSGSRRRSVHPAACKRLNRSLQVWPTAARTLAGSSFADVGLGLQSQFF